MKRNKNFLFLLYLVFIVDLVLLKQEHTYRIISKALLIPILLLFFHSTKPIIDKKNKAIYIGLFFSWLGDIFLMFETYFIPGLLCFLITHISYIVYFASLKGHKQSYLQQRPVMLLVILAYLLELLYMLWPGLGGLKIPVIVYATVISAMFAMAAWQYEKIDRLASIYFIVGSFLFVLSDSVLAIDKFIQPLPMGGILVMSTYVAAQLLIVLGVIRFNTWEVNVLQTSLDQ